MGVYWSHWPKANRVTLATVGKVQGVRTLHTMLAEAVSTLRELWAGWPCSPLHGSPRKQRIHPMSLLKGSEGPQASCSTAIHLACSSKQIRKLAHPWKESICSRIYYYFTLWETLQIHTWHPGKVRPPGLMLSPAARPRQRLKSQTDLAELGSWHPKFLGAANSECKKGHRLTLKKNNDSTLWSHLKLVFKWVSKGP